MAEVEENKPYHYNRSTGKLEVTGLKGLNGIGDLSSSEYTAAREDFIARGIIKYNTPADKFETIYANRKFLEKYGNDMELFNSMSREERDAKYRHDTINEVFSDVYGNDSRFEELNSFTDEVKLIMMRDGFLNDEENSNHSYSSSTKKMLEEEETREKSWFEKSAEFFDDGTSDFNGNKIAAKTAERAIGIETSKRENQLEKYASLSSAQRVEEAKPEVERFSRELEESFSKEGEEGASAIKDFEKEFDNLFYGQQSNGGIREGEDDRGVSQMYHALKEEIDKNCTIEDKKRIYGTFFSIARNTETGSPTEESIMQAVMATETMFKELMADSQNFNVFCNKTAKAVTTGIVSYAVQKIQAYGEKRAIYQDLLDSEGKGEHVAAFLEGKELVRDENGKIKRDENGIALTKDRKDKGLMNVKYWSGVEQFYTFDVNEIRKAYNDGGISKNQWFVKPGHETDFFSSQTLFEAIKMNKFLIVDAIEYAALAALQRGAVKAVGGKFGADGRLLAESTKFSKGLNTAASYAIAFNGARGIAQGYSTNEFEQAYEAYKQMNDKVFDERVNSGTKDYLNTDLGKADYDSRYAAELARYKEANIDAPKAAMKEEVLKMLKEQYGDTKSDSELQAFADKYVEDNFKTESESVINKRIDKIVRQQLGDNIKETDSYKRERAIADEQARRNAAKSAALTFYIEQIRYGVENAVFRDFLFGKGTREALKPNSSKLKVNWNGAVPTIKGTAKDIFAPIVRNLYGGAQSNYLDDVCVGLAKGLYQGKHNNYLVRYYSPESAIIGNSLTAETVDSFNIAFGDALNTAFSKQAFYDGFIGGIGSFSSFGINFNRITHSSPKGSNWVTKLNRFVQNPILDAIAQTNMRKLGMLSRMEEWKGIIGKNKNILTDVGRVVTAVNSKEFANYHSKSELASKDAKANEAYEIVTRLGDYMNDEVLSTNPLLSQAQGILEGLASGFLDEKTTNDLVTQFLGLAENVEIAAKENAREIALGRLKKNASYLLEMQDAYHTVVDDMRNSNLQKTLFAPSRADYIYKKLMEKDWTSRVSEMEKEISGKETPNTDTSNLSAKYGTENRYKLLVKGKEKEISSVEKDIEDYQNRISRLDERIEAIKKERIKRVDPETGIKRSDLELDALRKGRLDTLEKQIVLRNSLVTLFKASNRRLNEAKEELKTMKAEKKNLSSLRLLKGEEILNLPPQQRYEMLKHRNQFSEEQQLIIDKLENDLKAKDPSLITKIKDSAELAERLRLNKKAIEEIKYDPEASNLYANLLLNSRKEAIAGVAAEVQVQQAIKRIENAVKEHTEEAFKEYFVNNLEDFSFDIIARYSEEHQEDAPILKNLLEAAEVQKDLLDVIYEYADSKITDKDSRDEFIDLWTDFLITGVKEMFSKDEIMTYLEECVEKPEQQGDKELCNYFLEKIESKGHSRDAVVIHNRAERKAIERAKEKERLEAEKKLDGKNYGFNGFKVGDTIYAVSGEKVVTGEVVEFNTVNVENGTPYNEMAYKIVNKDGTTSIYRIKPDSPNLSKLSTTKPEVEKAPEVSPKPENTEEPSKNKHSVDDVEYENSTKDGVATTKYKQYRTTKEGEVKPVTGIRVKSEMINKDSEIVKSFLENLSDNKEELGDTIIVLETRNNGTKISASCKVPIVDTSTGEVRYIEAELELSELPSDTNKVTESEYLNNKKQKEEVTPTPAPTPAPSISVAKAISEIQVTEDGAAFTPNPADGFTGTPIKPIVVTTEEDSLERGEVVENNGELNASGLKDYGYRDLKEMGIMAPYDLDSSQPNSTYTGWIGWLQSNHINLHEIVDFELGRIFSENPDVPVYIMHMNPSKAAVFPQMGNRPIMVIEYTDSVKNIHSVDRGGVVTANGKEWLVVGSLVYNEKVLGDREAYNSTKGAPHGESTAFFKTHNNDTYYVSTGKPTNIESFRSGHIVTQLMEDSQAEVRDVNEFFKPENSRRNPYGLTSDDLIFGVQTRDASGDPVFNTTEENPSAKIHSPRDSEGNMGGVFMLIPTPTGEQIPVMLEAVSFQELQDGTPLKDRIMNLLVDGVYNADYGKRLVAIKSLVQYLYTSDTNNILVGRADNKKPIITVQHNGVSRTFVVGRDSVAEFIKAVEECNFRLNYSIPMLSDEIFRTMYIESGAIRTRVAELATEGSQFTVRALDSKGNKVEKKQLDTPKPNKEGFTSGVKFTATYKGKKYRNYGDGQFYDENNKPVSRNTPEWQSCMLQQYIKDKNLLPSVKENGKNGYVEYYIISSNGEERIYKKFADNSVHKLSAQDSSKFLSEITKNSELERRAKAQQEAAKELEEAKGVVPEEEINTSTWEVGEAPQEAPLPSEVITNQVLGDFEETKEDTSTPKVKEEPAKPEVKPDTKPKDINSLSGNKSLAELQTKKEITTFGGVMRDTAARTALLNIFRRKGIDFPPSKVAQEALLKKMGIPTEGITDLNMWLQNIEKCH